MFDTLFVDGVDVGSFGCVTSINGLYTTPPTRGDNLVIPGVDGVVYFDKPFDTGTVTLQVTVNGATTGTLNDSYDTLRALAKPGRRVNLVRRRSTGTTYLDVAAYGEYLSGLEPEVQLARFTKVALTFRVLSGLWYSTADQSASPGTFSVVGDARTRRIWITTSAATVTNDTNGSSFTYTGPGTGVVDVENMSAAEGATDTSHYLSWNYGDFPLTLEPGTNYVYGFTSLLYRGAYL